MTMDAMSAREMIRGVQNSFQFLTFLQLTSSMYPPEAEVKSKTIPFYDVIVVGGGTAGCVVASRLAEDGKTQVLLIEAGGNPPLQSMSPALLLYLKNSSIDWKYKADDSNTCKAVRNTSLSLGKVLGGSSTLNFLLYAEGSKADYDNWADIVNDSNWSADSVLPYLQKSQKLQDQTIEDSPDGEYFGYDGNIIITKDQSDDIDDFYTAFEEAGFPIRETTSIENPVGFQPALYNIGDGVRQGTANTYISPMKTFSNLHVLRNAMVTKIIFKKKKAVAVEVLLNKKLIKIKANLEIVVSAGAINTPKLLMLSGIGPKDALKSKGIKVIANLPVGKNLQYQMSTILVFSFKNTVGNKKPLDLGKYPASVILGFASLNKSKDQPDYLAINYINYASHLAGYSLLTYGINDKITNQLFSPSGKYKSSDKNKMIFTVLSNLNMKTRGEVTLQSTNPKKPPIINANKKYYSTDIKNQVKYIEDFFKVMDTPTFKELGAKFLAPELKQCKGLEKYSKEYWTCYANCMKSLRPLFAGTTAMNEVVDSRLRVLGVQGLRVVDAGIMPVLVRSLPFGATVMIGEKAADMIKEDNNL